MGSSSKESSTKGKRSSKSEKSTKKEKSAKDKASKKEEPVDDNVDKKSKKEKKDKSKKKEKKNKDDDKEKKTKKKSKEQKRRSSISSISSEDPASEADSADSASDSESEIDHLKRQQKEAELLVRDIETGLENYVATNLDMVRYKQLNTEETEDQRVQKRFKEIYMDYVATGFSADLDLLRKESEIDDDGLEMLIDVLETGMLSFKPADQKMIVDELP
ncbi:hypothetical protein GGI15_004314 [Coemansia interrupta]|uniref:Ribosome-assembly protein 3 C-terminal domain-containing protein n=1 Tax=Coemansia interrupta TaxID=1126814 RepID=A0A9W8LGB4_9FUNG|nr:hypothetical protein GGI15_004314 [Coemansia interrupta]